jgi:hypothetical protein
MSAQVPLLGQSGHCHLAIPRIPSCRRIKQCGSREANAIDKSSSISFFLQVRFSRQRELLTDLKASSTYKIYDSPQKLGVSLKCRNRGKLILLQRPKESFLDIGHVHSRLANRNCPVKSGTQCASVLVGHPLPIV